MGREFRMKANHNWAGLAAWNFKSKAECHTYEEYEKFLGTRDERKIASNATVKRYSWPLANPHYTVLGSVGIKLYETVILMYFSDGTFSADNGGYDTPTTIYRLHRFGPVGASFYHKDRKLYCWGLGPCDLETPYPVAGMPDAASAGPLPAVVGPTTQALSTEETPAQGSPLSGEEDRRFLFLTGLLRRRRAVTPVVGFTNHPRATPTQGGVCP